MVTVELYEKGYRVCDGVVVSPRGTVLSVQLNGKGYYAFTHRMRNGKNAKASVHKLVAYQKFGNESLKEGIHVRHRDGNPLNNSDDNILIGTASENMMDKTQEVRIAAAMAATSCVKIHDHEAILRRRSEGATYKQIMSEFNISSTATVSFIINKSLAGGGIERLRSTADALPLSR